MEGVKVGGLRLPYTEYTEAWKGDRFLEFSYLDEDFAAARGVGGLPHSWSGPRINECIGAFICCPPDVKCDG